jgi:hypothetical protein
MTTGLIITAASLSALGWMLYLVWTAPTGYEDETGFHYGEPHSDFDGDE